jgi:hypothetical protein
MTIRFHTYCDAKSLIWRQLEADQKDGHQIPTIEFITEFIEVILKIFLTDIMMYTQE